MTPHIGSRRLAVGLVASLGVLAAGPGRGDTVEASSTTLLMVRAQQREGGLRTVAPIYELLTVSGRDIGNPIAENLQFVFSGYGAGSIGRNLVWYSGASPQDRFFADFDLAYVQGELFRRAVQLRLGRQMVGGGVAGMLQVDGAGAIVRLPVGIGLSAFAGSPVSHLFDARGGDPTYNPYRGTFATGGRASFTLPSWGEIGASMVEVKDGGDPGRRQAGADVRVMPLPALTLFANTNYDLHEKRWAENNVVAQVQVLPKLLVRADYRQVDPDLLLARDSILAIFTSERRNEVGAGFQYGVWKGFTFSGDYHRLKEQDGNGHRASGRATWVAAHGLTAGAELGFQSMSSHPSGSYLNNGYLLARAFCSKNFGRVAGTLDLQEYALRNEVNGSKNSFLGTATAAYLLGRGFSVLLSGSGGATPYYERRFDVLAKLSYNQSYPLGEVR